MRTYKEKHDYIIPDLLGFISNQGERAWIKDAACRGMGTEPFFVERGQEKKAKATAEAFCNNCKVQQECLHYGAYEEHGIWGGKGRVARIEWRNENNIEFTDETVPAP